MLVEKLVGASTFGIAGIDSSGAKKSDSNRLHHVAIMCYHEVSAAERDTYAGNPSRKEAPMATTFKIFCPCSCGSVVEASDAGFAATSIEVVACETLQADGIASTNIPKSEGIRLYAHKPMVRHTTGLVTFEGGELAEQAEQAACQTCRDNYFTAEECAEFHARRKVAQR